MRQRCLLSIIVRGKAIFLLLLIFNINSFSQNTRDLTNDSTFSKNRNMVSVEIGGNGFTYSLNYSRILSNTIISRIGLSYLFDQDLDEIIIPVEIYLRSKGKKHHFEAGIGITPTFMIRKDKNNYIYWSLFGRIGYSYHKTGMPWNFRIGFTPFFSPEVSDVIIQPYGGISIGYLF